MERFAECCEFRTRRSVRMRVELRKYFTVFAVSDAVFAQEGITSFSALAAKLEH